MNELCLVMYGFRLVRAGRARDSASRTKPVWNICVGHENGSHPRRPSRGDHPPEGRTHTLGQDSGQRAHVGTRLVLQAVCRQARPAKTRSPSSGRYLPNESTRGLEHQRGQREANTGEDSKLVFYRFGDQ